MKVWHKLKVGGGAQIAGWVVALWVGHELKVASSNGDGAQIEV